METLWTRINIIFFLKPFSHFEKHNSPTLVELERKSFYFLCPRPYIVCHYESVYALICDAFTLKKYLVNICCIILLVDFLESWRVLAQFQTCNTQRQKPNIY